MNILSTKMMAVSVERVSGSCLELLSLCPELSPEDIKARKELIVMMSESRNMVELCQALAQEGIANTEEIQHANVSVYLRRFFSQIYAFEQRLSVLLQKQTDKMKIIRSLGLNVGLNY